MSESQQVSATLDKPAFIFSDFLVRPHVRLFKIMTISLCCALLFICLTILGFRGKRHKKVAQIPYTIARHEFAIPSLVILCIVSLGGIILLLRTKDTLEDHRIIISKRAVKIRASGEQTVIKLYPDSQVSFRVIPLYHKLFFDKFHRIGRINVIRKDGRHTWYFPVRNESIGNELSHKLSDELAEV